MNRFKGIGSVKSLSLWNYNTRNNISFTISKFTLIYLIVSIDFTNDQNAMHRVIWGYNYTLKIKTQIKDNT